MLNEETFPDVFAGRPKWFHSVEELFRFGVMEPEKGRKEPEKEGVKLCDVTRLKYP
jgi:hypothetical protein